MHGHADTWGILGNKMSGPPESNQDHQHSSLLDLSQDPRSEWNAWEGMLFVLTIELETHLLWSPDLEPSRTVDWAPFVLLKCKEIARGGSPLSKCSEPPNHVVPIRGPWRSACWGEDPVRRCRTLLRGSPAWFGHCRVWMNTNSRRFMCNWDSWGVHVLCVTCSSRWARHPIKESSVISLFVSGRGWKGPLPPWEKLVLRAEEGESKLF